MNLSFPPRDFWLERREVNARKAIFHQWEQLEASGCIENFRIAAGESAGLRVGWFFADSDAYKWLEAAARIWANQPDPELGALMDDLIALLGRTQMEDGYLFTYNQIYFPGVRWQNLQIEHELYCHGHLIEVGVSHYQSTGQFNLLHIARRAADRVCFDFRDKGPQYTPGHEEIELALLRLHRITPGDNAYLDMARQFIEQRGRTKGYAVSLLRQNRSVAQRRKRIQQERQKYLAEHPEYRPFQLPPDNASKLQPGSALRRVTSALSGEYLQQHAPVREQTVPVGHAVRFGYLETAAAMLVRSGGDASLLPALEQTWERMVTRRMYVTGGLGAVPVLEGFGRDYELDPQYAYAETCAALACLFWNWEMVLNTGEARYSDLFEWQLYNAAGVGMGLDGTTYLYNNPLVSSGDVLRQPWYAVPCCPSNLSRTWADLHNHIFSAERGGLRIHQYISTMQERWVIPDAVSGSATASLRLESELPWEGRARITIEDTAYDTITGFALQLRQPSWASGMQISINGELSALYAANPLPAEATASGYDPRTAAFQNVTRTWAAGDVVDLRFEMPVLLRRAHAKVRGHAGKAALTRGPLVYCLESVDNPGVDVLTARLDPATLNPVYDAELLGGIVKIEAKTTAGTPLIFIPYFLWGNRGPSRMTVWVNAGD